MFSTRRRIVLPLLAALMLGLLAIGVSACGSGDPHEVEEGEVVKVNGLKYTVIFSRYLNEHDNEDAAYLSGLGPPTAEDSNYFGVFVMVQNTTHETKGLTEEMTITDVTGKKFEAVKTENEYSFPFGGTVEEQEQIPLFDSTAASSPLGGDVVVFELPEEVSSNRPLLLHIAGPGKESGVVKIDL